MIGTAIALLLLAIMDLYKLMKHGRKNMNRTWFSYVVLAVGLMLLVASDKQASADDEKSAHTISFNTDKKIEVLINQDGDDDPQVDIVVDGKEYSFALPELSDGQDKVITTEDGKEIIIKSVSGNKVIWIDGNQMHLPSFSDHHVTAEGLSAMIGRTHQLEIKDEVTISAHGLSDDVKSAIVDAVKGVLTSYDVDKNVSFHKNKFGLHMISPDVKVKDMGNYEYKIKTEFIEDTDHNVIVEEIKEVEKRHRKN